jgi:hypothetical protein
MRLISQKTTIQIRVKDAPKFNKFWMPKQEKKNRKGKDPPENVFL